MRGVQGVRLETLKVGGTRCTSIEALQRFFDALSAEEERPSPSVPASRYREIECAAAEVDAILAGSRG